MTAPDLTVRGHALTLHASTLRGDQRKRLRCKWCNRLEPLGVFMGLPTCIGRPPVVDLDEHTDSGPAPPYTLTPTGVAGLPPQTGTAPEALEASGAAVAFAVCTTIEDGTSEG